MTDQSGPPDSVKDLGLETQEGDHGEPKEQPKSGNGPAPSPGSVSFFGEGKFRFPKALLEGGGSGILSNPIAFGVQDYLVSESIFDVNTSIEGVMLFMLRNALQNKGKNWPELLMGFSWFPRVLGDVSQAKRDARWQWITEHEPADPDSLKTIPKHSFWLQGYGNDKIKDDRMIEANGYKILNYAEFRGIIRSVASEIKSKSLGPIEIGNLGRRHWNALREPLITDLKKRVLRKKKRAHGKSAGKTPAKQPNQNPPLPADPQVAAQDPAGAPAQATVQAPLVVAEGMEAESVGNTTAQSNAVQGGATAGSTQPPPTNNQIPPLIQQVGFPPYPGFQTQEMAHLGYSEAAPFGGRGFQRGHGRSRNRGGGGRKSNKSYPRGPRGGGNTNPRGGGNTNSRGGGYSNPGNPGPADVSSRGNGGFNRGGFGQGFYQVWCRTCNVPFPSWIKYCTHCQAIIN